MHTSQPDSKPTVVLGNVPSLGVVAIPFHEARRRVELEAALSDAHTWGEAFAVLTPRQAAEITLLLYDAWMEDGGAVPSDDEPFDAETVLGLNDGTWIGWPPRDAIDHDWFPSSVTTIGTVHQTSHDGPYLSFDSAHLDRLMQALEAEGYTVTRDDALVDAACGGYGGTSVYDVLDRG